MKVELCKRSLLRLGTDGSDALVEALREREHTPVLKDCLNRCAPCERGLLVATVGGYPLGVADAEKLLHDVDALQAEEG